MRRVGLIALVLVMGIEAAGEGGPMPIQSGESIYIQNGDVRLHAKVFGEGELLVMLHGFPDFWYSWRNQIPELSKHFRVVALDLRGYNESDKPPGVDAYKMDKLVGDVVAVIDHFGAKQATVVGHDWGGAVAWSVAMAQPDRVSRLVILNLPHPQGLLRELANNPKQRENSQYARDFQQPGAEQNLFPEMLAAWVSDSETRKHYVEAFRRSSIESMLNYYRANYPREPYPFDESHSVPPVKCPVLMFHGLDDKYLLPGALNDTWQWVDNELTLVTIPGAGHFVQHDAADRVTSRMVEWLTRTP